MNNGIKQKMNNEYLDLENQELWIMSNQKSTRINRIN